MAAPCASVAPCARASLAVVAAVCLASRVPVRARTPADLVISAATVVDVQAGTTSPGRTIVITAGRIVDVGRRRPPIRGRPRGRCRRRVRHARAVGQPRALRRRRGAGRGEPESPAALPRPRNHHGARRRRRSQCQRPRVAIAGGRGHAARADHLHVGPQARGHRFDLAGRPRGRQRGRRARRARPVAGDARRLREDHREHSDAGALPVRTRPGAAARLHRLGARPGRPHARPGVRGRTRVDRAHVVSAARRLATRSRAECRRRCRPDSAADAVTAMVDGFDESTALATFGRLAARGTAVTPTLERQPCPGLSRSGHTRQRRLPEVHRSRPSGDLCRPRDPRRR